MANSAKERKKLKDKKDAANVVKRRPSASAAVIRQAQQAADSDAAGSASVDEVMRRAAERAGSSVPPVLMRSTGGLEATDFQIGQDENEVRDMPSTGTARLSERTIEPVEGPLSKDFIADLQFMEEKVEVMVHDTSDKNAAKLVQVWNDGRAQFFIRGQSIAVRRKFVEVLARSKETGYTQQSYKDENGFDAIRNIPHTALRFPFSIIHDPNPNGHAWLRKVLNEAN